MDMNMNMGNVVYWYKNQVVITFSSELGPDAAQNVILNKVSLYQQHLNDQNLNTSSFVLSRTGNANATDGIYVFPAADPLRADIAVFYNIESRNTKAMPDTMDHTLEVIDHLQMQMEVDQTRFDAMPHWLWGGTPDTIHGCPVSPPIPVEDPQTYGQWQITLPPLSDPSLSAKTGAGVTVFVLDTLPSYQQIKQAAKRSGGYNRLLHKMTTGMVNEPRFKAVPPAINVNYTYAVPDPAQSAMTGKDIYGRLVGFPMEDHGLSIAGIVRDLAPGANIECIRVLNDYGVGDTNTLYKALEYIRQRMLPGKDLYEKPVVINMSLVVIPPKSDWANFGWDKEPDKPKRMLEGLSKRMRSLAQVGATFVASAGNDTDARDTQMNPFEMRFGPRYPAAFLYDEPDNIKTMIPVGAVTRDGKAAPYSNYPGELGIGAYGGDLPKADPWAPSAVSHINAQAVMPTDALCGVYSAECYPALSKNDQYPSSASMPESAYPMSPRHNSSAWAYWSGTSFATPIITAMAARILEGKQPGSVDVRQAVITAAAQRIVWTRLDPTGQDVEDKPAIFTNPVQQWVSGRDSESE